MPTQRRKHRSITSYIKALSLHESPLNLSFESSQRSSSDPDSPAPKGTYEYEAIAATDTIRLLELLPSTQEPLACKLSHAKLDGDLDFEALSYTWGQPRFPNVLRVEPSGTCLTITDNLKDALVALRRKDTSRILWVDAVCINQADDIEKARQVKMMKEIYQGSRKVIVWLGKEADDPETFELLKQGFAQLGEIGRDCLSYGFNHEELSPSLHVTDKTALENLRKLTREGDGRAMLGVYHRDWYQRVWIVQEFILAQDLEMRCGSLSMTYELFSRATIVLRLIRDRITLLRELWDNEKEFAHVLFDPGFDQAWGLVQQRERYLSTAHTKYDRAKHGSLYNYEDPILRPSSIIEYCSFARNLKCSKEVDRMYGMLGFAHDSGIDIEVDYTSSPEKVWERLALKSLLLGDLTVLHWAGAPSHGKARVKSFVADFGRKKDEADSILQFGGNGLPVFHSATSLQPKIELESDGNVRVHAIKVDTVNQVTNVLEETGEDLWETIVGRNNPISRQVDDIIARNPELSRRRHGTGSISRDALIRVYRWWMFWLNAEGPRWYNDDVGELAFRRTIIADCALPRTKNMCGWVSKLELDLFFVIFMLAGDGLYVDSLEVFKWMQRPVQLTLQPWVDGIAPKTYFFPTLYGVDEEDLAWHAKARAEEVPLPEIQPGASIIEIPPPLRQRLNDYKLAIQDVLTDRVLFFTNVRMLGLGPKGLKSCDVIMVPEGSQTPFAYRPVAEGEGYVRRGELIGECFVFGLMDGDPSEKLKATYEESHLEVILV